MGSDLGEVLLSGSVLTIRSRGLPPISVDLTPGGQAEGGAVVKLLRPSVTFARNGVELYHAAPYGEPEASTWVFVAAACIVLGLLVLSFAR